MNVVPFSGSFAHWIGSFYLDDSTAAVLALLVGVIGGYRLTGWHQQLKAKRARIARKPQTLPRKPD